MDSGVSNGVAGFGNSPGLVELMGMVTPPASGGLRVDWDRAVREYGHGFPRDYMEFMSVYGEGVFDDFVSVNAPFPDAYPDDPDSSVRGVTANARSMGEEEDYDAPELLVGWGDTVNANVLCWRMVDPNPDHWTTVIFGAGDPWTELDCGMVELLCRWVTNRIPYFGVSQMELPYQGSRFLRNRDMRSLRHRGIDAWGVDPVT